MVALALKYTKQIISIYFFLIFFSLLLLLPQKAFTYHLSHIAVNVINNNEISVTGSLNVEQKFIEELTEGMSKEIIFYIDLFRIWKIWPNEFVKGKKIIRSLKSDPIKREYIGVSIEGNISVEKRFRDIESMILWAINFTDVRIANVRDFEAGDYFIRVTAESTKKKLPPLIGYFLFFVSEKEFYTSRDSQSFQLPREPVR